MREYIENASEVILPYKHRPLRRIEEEHMHWKKRRELRMMSANAMRGDELKIYSSKK